MFARGGDRTIVDTRLAKVDMCGTVHQKKTVRLKIASMCALETSELEAGRIHLANLSKGTDGMKSNSSGSSEGS